MKGIKVQGAGVYVDIRQKYGNLRRVNRIKESVECVGWHDILGGGSGYEDSGDLVTICISFDFEVIANFPGSEWISGWRWWGTQQEVAVL